MALSDERDTTEQLLPGLLIQGEENLSYDILINICYAAGRIFARHAQSAAERVERGCTDGLVLVS